MRREAGERQQLDEINSDIPRNASYAAKTASDEMRSKRGLIKSVVLLHAAPTAGGMASPTAPPPPPSATLLQCDCKSVCLFCPVQRAKLLGKRCLRLPFPSGVTSGIGGPPFSKILLAQTTCVMQCGAEPCAVVVKRADECVQ